MRGVILVCLMVCAVLLLAKQGEGHVTFFSPKQMKTMEMEAKQKELGARSEDGTPEDTSVQPVPQEEMVPEPQPEPAAQGTEVEIAIKLSAEQLEHITQGLIKDALEHGAVAV
ncbi:motilin-like [Engraulis encrasicolus]|uniref:motilin-like n=1 Tax=Engraulis encrasicolus TaxID=184585 RepID=UPI002FD0201E